MTGRKGHWEEVHASKAPDEVSWYQAEPEPSLSLILASGAALERGVIDVGAGASRLPEALVAAGVRDVTALDIAGSALDRLRARLGPDAPVKFVVADVLNWRPARRFGVWHDRAVFHFLTRADERARYARTLRAATTEGSRVIIGTFAPDGPDRCSGLPVMRHDAQSIAKALGPGFRLVDSLRHEHLTPSGVLQPFTFAVFTREASNGNQ
ncbi:MAG: class I SAM-dependent methyltransferase [Alphaproteobacteria bacterium]|nr:MAG: class I SAM-dependent methyltransferase [Alphaproteobacteria bacterium]